MQKLDKGKPWKRIWKCSLSDDDNDDEVQDKVCVGGLASEILNSDNGKNLTYELLVVSEAQVLKTGSDGRDKDSYIARDRKKLTDSVWQLTASLMER
jgi:hypothetical protein